MGYTYSLVWKSTYDSLGRLVARSQYHPYSFLLNVAYNYNENSQLTKEEWLLNGGATYANLYTYNTEDGSLKTMTHATGQTSTYAYDYLRRLSSISSGIHTRTYTYRDISSTQTTAQVSSLAYSGIGSPITFGYTYDAVGNIATYAQTGKSTVTYTYDSQGQLLKATGGTTYTYTYDTVGNILTASNGTTTHSYTYGNSQWRDLLTAFDGQSITYDTAGNPTSYYNGTRWTLTWGKGKRLLTASDGTNTISFSTNEDGTRAGKTVNGTRYDYIFNGSRLMREYYSGAVLDFIYDADGRPYALNYNGTYYYYVLNLQGDVIRLVNSSGATVASYEYDPYGKVLSATGSMAAINPLRYRGYYYDEETGLYYLMSRYYDPQTGRFINADSYASTGQGFSGYNMFVYCGNNPVNCSDPTGEIAISTLILIGSAIFGLVSAGYTAYQTYQAGWDTGEILWYTFGAGLGGFLTVYSCGMSAYQMYTQYCYINGITPVTEIGTKSVEQQLQTCANTANASVSGTGAVAGTKKHTAFSNAVNNLGNSSLRTEVSYLDGDEVPYGTKGSIRFDVVLYNNGVPIQAWDFKTGAATLSASRISAMQIGSGLVNLPISEIR